MSQIVKDLLVSRQLGHQILRLIDVLADDQPPHVWVDAVMTVGASFVTSEDLDEDKIAAEWLSTVKELKARKKEKKDDTE
jgi:hypothetical protein